MQPVSPTREPAQGPETLHPAEPVAAPDWRLWWLASTAFWTIAGFASATFFFMSRPFGAEVSWGYALRTTMISSYLWIPLTVGIFWVAHRYPLERAVLARSLPVHAVAGVLIAALRTLLVLGLNPVVGWYADLPPFSKLLFCGRRSASWSRIWRSSRPASRTVSPLPGRWSRRPSTRWSRTCSSSRSWRTPYDTASRRGPRPGAWRSLPGSPGGGCG
jgi:hypothetical protein